MTLSDLVASIDTDRQYGNLSSAIRLFVLDFYRNRLANDKDGRDGTRDAIAVPPLRRHSVAIANSAAVHFDATFGISRARWI